MAPLCYAAKFDPFLSLDCAGVEVVGAQSGNDGIKFCSVAKGSHSPLSQKALTQSKNFATAIWQPYRESKGGEKKRGKKDSGFAREHRGIFSEEEAKANTHARYSFTTSPSKM